MKHVWLVAAMSANGMIAQSSEQSSLDWTSKEDLQFFIEKTKEAGVVIMGRKTFDTIGKPLKGRRLIVMTTQTDLSFDGEGVEYTNQQPKQLLETLKEEGVERIVIAGGAKIYSLFLQEGLVTDVFLSVEPVLFGEGVPLLNGCDRIDLTLKEIKSLNEQTILLHYKV